MRTEERLRQAQRDGDQTTEIRMRLRSGEVCSRCGGIVACEGAHRGRRGDTGCPAQWHHHHDHGCRPGLSGIVMVPDMSRLPFHLPLPACPRCAGLTLRQRVELAAYCGDEAAREYLGDGGGDMVPEGMRALPSKRKRASRWSTHDARSLTTWIVGLSRWGKPVLVRAAVAAAREALPVWEAHEDDGGEGLWCPPHVETATGYLDHISDEIGCAGCGTPRGEHGASAPLRAIEAVERWLECPCEEHLAKWGAFGHSLPMWFPHAPRGIHLAWEVSIQEAASLLGPDGEARVRAAIQRALIEWAL